MGIVVIFLSYKMSDCDMKIQYTTLIVNSKILTCVFERIDTAAVDTHLKMQVCAC